MGKEENEIRAVQLEAVKRHSIETMSPRCSLADQAGWVQCIRE